MEAKEFRKVILFMANRWDKETAIAIFGSNLGQHFYGKWVDAYGEPYTPSYNGPDYATMRLFYDMTEDNLQKLLDYVEANYRG